MDKYIYDKSNGLWYVLTVDWLGWLCYLVQYSFFLKIQTVKGKDRINSNMEPLIKINCPNDGILKSIAAIPTAQSKDMIRNTISLSSPAK